MAKNKRGKTEKVGFLFAISFFFCCFCQGGTNRRAASLGEEILDSKWCSEMNRGRGHIMVRTDEPKEEARSEWRAKGGANARVRRRRVFVCAQRFVEEPKVDKRREPRGEKHSPVATQGVNITPKS